MKNKLFSVALAVTMLTATGLSVGNQRGPPRAAARA